MDGQIMWCNPCIAERLEAATKAGLDSVVGEKTPQLGLEYTVTVRTLIGDNVDVVIPACYPGATLASQWTSQSQVGQMMFGVVAVPTCVEKHLKPQKLSRIATS